MSFGDIQNTRGTSSGTIKKGPSGYGDLTSSSEKDTIGLLRNSISSFQRGCLSAKERITEMRRRKVSQSEKNQLELQIKDLRHQENGIKIQFDSKQKELDNLPRQDAALQKATLAKLFKDYERLKVSLEGIISESQLVKADAGVKSDTFARTGNGNINFAVEEPRRPDDNTIVVTNGNQKLILKPLVQANDVDDMIIEEREKEIKKLHDDLLLVNDMYKQMADIIQEQGVHVDHIHKTTDESHQRAEAGLEQVKQAANYQPTCTMS